ncbi:hypothetical protein PV326_004078 [Microctonus aethiopoides]|nr:hypothetical protein PV326_004078 [Microctonus aethiopoides]
MIVQLVIKWNGENCDCERGPCGRLVERSHNVSECRVRCTKRSQRPRSQSQFRHSIALDCELYNHEPKWNGAWVVSSVHQKLQMASAVAYLFARHNNTSESTSFSSDEEWNAFLHNYNREKRILRLRILWYNHMGRCERLVAKVMTSFMTYSPRPRRPRSPSGTA